MGSDTRVRLVTTMVRTGARVTALALESATTTMALREAMLLLVLVLKTDSASLCSHHLHNLPNIGKWGLRVRSLVISMNDRRGMDSVMES